MKRNLILAICLWSAIHVQAINLFPHDDKASEMRKVEHKADVQGEAMSWEFYSAIKAPTNEELAREANYKFGEEAGYLYSLFMSVYVVREEVVPGDPTRRTVIRKPAIYNAVRSLEKHYNKEVKKNGLSSAVATSEFLQILKIALAAFDSESKSFEDSLQENRKDATSLTAVFKHVRLTEI